MTKQSVLDRLNAKVEEIYQIQKQNRITPSDSYDSTLKKLQTELEVICKDLERVMRS